MHTAKILKTEMLNHNVKRFVVEKPAGYRFTPGQATLIELPEKKGDKHPFTFTSLNEEPTLEFTIKLYHKHHGVTDMLTSYREGDTLRFEGPWGAIEYKGPGLFLAGGAGITPFLAILRMLAREKKMPGNALWFSNKTVKDIFLEEELRGMLDTELKLLVTEEETEGYEKARLDEAYLKKNVRDFAQHFYICGPDKMVKALKAALADLGAAPDKIVTEDLG